MLISQKTGLSFVHFCFLHKMPYFMIRLDFFIQKFITRILYLLKFFKNYFLIFDTKMTGFIVTSCHLYFLSGADSCGSWACGIKDWLHHSTRLANKRAWYLPVSPVWKITSASWAGTPCKDTYTVKVSISSWLI